MPATTKPKSSADDSLKMFTICEKCVGMDGKYALEVPFRRVPADDETTYATPSEMEGQTLGDIPADADVPVEASEADAVAVSHGDGVADDEAGLKQDGLENVDVIDAKSKTPTKRKKQPAQKLYVWRPLEFPSVPEKGGFDVTRLKQSKYFFH